jgi:PAS domain S-box-containing protein
VKGGVIATNVLVVALAAVVTLQTLEGHRAGARTHADNLARFLGAGLEAALGKVDLTLRTVADEERRLAASGPIDARALEAFLARHLARTPDVASLRVLGADGLARYNAPPVPTPVSLADREYFTALRDRPIDALYVSRPFMGRILPAPLVVAARPLPAPPGSFAGVVTGAIPLSRLAALFADIEVGARGVVEIRSHDGRLAVGKGPGAPAAFGDARFPPELLEAVAAGPGAVTRDATSAVDAVERTYAVRRLEGYPLLVVVGLAPDDYLAGWRRAAAVVWVLVAAFVALTIGLAWYGTPAWQRAEVERLLLERTENLRESEERFRIAFQTSPDAIAITRISDGAYVAVNEGFLALTGYTEAELIGRSSLDLGIWDDPADRGRLVEGLRRDGFMQNLDARFRGTGGRVIDGLMSARRIVLRGEPLLLTITRDVTAWKSAEAERDRLRTQVLQAQRLEGIGRLAGGIAHDFNNLLTVILASIESLRDRVGDAPEPREDLEQIAAAAGRARDLTRQLLTFARKQVIAPVALDLGAVVRDAERLLRRLIGEDVALTVEVDEGLWPVLCDPAQLEQVLLNLAVNARDAMPAGGTLSIAARNVDAARPVDGGGGAPGPGEWVRLSVRDSGTGMTPDVEAHLFEPFFTTKADAKGTGLGLATVHGIVAQNGGHIDVVTAPGRGSAFHVFLPRAAGAAVAPPAPPPPRAAPAGGATVLVVEDDPLVRNVTVRVLRGAGYDVLVAGAGAEAIELAARRTGPIDLVVTDVVMPGLSGPQVVAALQTSRPGLPALYVSGYPADALARRSVVDDAAVELLPKPFTAAALLERVRAIVEARAAHRA